MGTVGAAAVLGTGLAAPGVASAIPSPNLVVTPGEGDQQWTVPTAVCGVTFDLYGGHGGDMVGEGTARGGAAGHVQATVTVTPGQKFLLQAGAAGADNSYNAVTAGGLSGSSPSGGDGWSESGAGGGASVVRPGWSTTGSPLLVAGGGGGAGFGPLGGNGAPTGTAGEDSLSYAGYGGTGGDFSTPGAGGAAMAPAPQYWSPVSGGAAQGMLGGDAPTGAGGGGGGGYQGGGAGAGGTHMYAGSFFSAGGGGGANLLADVVGVVPLANDTADGAIRSGSIALTYEACAPAVAPGAPRDVQATADNAQVAVTWLAPNTGGPVDHYEVTMSPGGQTCITAHLTCLFGGQAHTVYTATVVAVGHDGATGPSASGTSALVEPPRVPAEAPDTTLTLTTDKGVITTTTPGSHITVLGTGFLPFSTATVVIYSTPTVLGTVVTDAHGDFSKPVTVPATLAAGHHALIASGVAPDGTDRFLRMNVTVGSPVNGTVDTPVNGTVGTPVHVTTGAHGGRSSELAYTGAGVITPAVLGGGLLALGLVLLVVARRRRRIRA